MSFPANPHNGDIATDSGFEYVYREDKKRWQKTSRPPFTTWIQKDIPSDYTISVSDIFCELYYSGSIPVTWSLANNVPRGSKIRVVGSQVDGADINFAALPGATLGGLEGFQKTGGPGATMLLEVISNTTGTNAVWAPSGGGA